MLTPSTKIYVDNSTVEGLGVFASDTIQEGELITEVPIILIPESDLSDLTKTKLLDYYFAWGQGFRQAAIALGYGSLFNHSYHPNARYYKDFENQTIRFVALKKIEINEEILVNYNEDPDDQTKLWFEARNFR
jgi:SET domain-containing protein